MEKKRLLSAVWLMKGAVSVCVCDDAVTAHSPEDPLPKLSAPSSVGLLAPPAFFSLSAQWGLGGAVTC